MREVDVISGYLLLPVSAKVMESRILVAMTTKYQATTAWKMAATRLSLVSTTAVLSLFLAPWAVCVNNVQLSN